MKEKKQKIFTRNTGKEIAYLAVFVALVITLQFCLSALPGVELVTVFFVGYAFTFGVGRGCLAAVAFALLRQLVFGFYLSVLLLYLAYYPLLTVGFGLLGKGVKNPVKGLWLLTLLACLGSCIFYALDCVITPLWYGYSWAATKAYVLACLPLLLPQLLCTAVTVGVLFLPLERVFGRVKKNLR